MVSSYTVNFALSSYKGHPGQLVHQGLANFGVFEDPRYDVWDMPIFIVIGIIGGLLGALFTGLNTQLSNYRKMCLVTKCQRLTEALLVAAMSAFVAFFTPLVVKDCQLISSENISNVAEIYCQPGEYNTLANLFVSLPQQSIQTLFHAPIDSFNMITLLVFAIEYFILSMWTFGLSIPSGVFIPTLLTGAAWGRLIGLVLYILLPDLIKPNAPNIFALAGAAAQLGGIVRMTISLTALIMEAAQSMTLGLPIMLCLMTANWVGNFFNSGLFNEHIELDEIPILGWSAPRISRNISAENVMHKNVVALEPRERVSHIIDVLLETSHHGFPVVDRIEDIGDCELPEYGRVKGLVLRQQLLTLIQKRIFETDDHLPLFERSLSSADFAQEYSRREQKDFMNLTEKEENCWIDLTPYMHTAPHRVQLNASLPSVFRIFRGLGLRYLIVVDDENKLRGIITRKDMARFREQRRNKRNELSVPHR